MIVQPRETVIDLGVLPSPDAPDADIPPPVGPRWRTGSRLAGAVLMAAVGATVAGVPHPAAPAIRHVPTIPAAGSSYTIVRDTVYVQDQQPGRDTTVTAYDLRDGSKRWSTLVEPQVHLFEVGDRLLGARENFANIFAIDPDTGAVGWRHDGELVGFTAGSVLMADVDDQGRWHRLRRVDMGTGEEVWSLPFRQRIYGRGITTAPEPSANPQHLVVPMPDGWAVVYRLTDGTEVARARLGVRGVVPSDDEEMPEDHLIGGDGLIYLARPDASGPGATVTAYRTEDLTRQWRRHIPAMRARMCGPVLCVPDGSALSAFDARTGVPLWTRPGPLTGQALGTDLLIESQGDDWAGPESAVLDARTGRVVTGLAPYRRITGSEELLMRPDRVAPGVSVVARLDPASGTLTNLGRVHGGWDQCQASGPYVLCRAGGQVRVWGIAGR